MRSSSKHVSSNNILVKLRLDKWLWASRFFKTRRAAAEAITGGKVRLNEQRVKPSKEVRIGDKLKISKGTYRWELEVRHLYEKRRPASEAQLMYEETTASHEKRKKLIATNKALRSSEPKHDKPNKKQRRQIHRFKQSPLT